MPSRTAPSKVQNLVKLNTFRSHLSKAAAILKLHIVIHGGIILGRLLSLTPVVEYNLDLPLTQDAIVANKGLVRAKVGVWWQFY